MKNVSKVLNQAVKVVSLDLELYRELAGWGVFFSCPISQADLEKNTYLCAVLRMSDGMYAGTAIFQKRGNHALFLYLELIHALRGKELGKALFNHATGQLKQMGVTQVIANDPMDYGQTMYMYELGFQAADQSTYIDYDYAALVRSPLYQKRDKLTAFIRNVKLGSELSAEVKTEFLHSLRKSNKDVSEELLANPQSLFYVNNGRVNGYIGVKTDAEKNLLVVDRAFLNKKVNGIDIRIAFLGKLLEMMDQRNAGTESNRLVFMIADQETGRGLETVIDKPELKKTITTYKYIP